MEKYLVELSKEFVNQQKCKVIVAPNEDLTGFWFGAGNIVEVNEEVEGIKQQTLYLSGRYRNFGDSRKGLELGQRGISVALFSSTDKGTTWKLAKEWNKHELSQHLSQKILSIEGNCLYFNESTKKWEFYISSEKEKEYPQEISEYRKPGTGIWSIDVIQSDTSSILTLNPSSIREVISTSSEDILHVKDPFVYSYFRSSDQKRITKMIFCTHPFNWSSSNCALAVRENEEDVFNYHIENDQFVGRGKCWDVSVCRITSKFDVPPLLIHQIKSQINQQEKLDKEDEEKEEKYSFYYYDGAECVRELEQNKVGIIRSRGHSCEELGGLFIQKNDGELKRISLKFPMFISPFGSGCCRYISSYALSEGVITIWQQSQNSFAQSLVATYYSFDDLISFIRSISL